MDARIFGGHRRSWAPLSQAGCRLIPTGKDAVRVTARNGGSATVPVEWTRMHLGGRRPWFICPGCSRRVGVLYPEECAGSLALRCRECGGFAYPTQRERKTARLDRKAESARQAAFGVGLWPMPLRRSSRPHGMRRATWARLVARAWEAEEAANAALEAEIATWGAAIQARRGALEPEVRRFLGL